jgi:hypothetical protein
MDRHAIPRPSAIPAIRWHLVAWFMVLAGIPLIAGIALLVGLNAHAAITAVGIYYVALAMWAVLRAMGGARATNRSSQIVLAVGVIAGVLTANTAVALTLCMFGLAGVALGIAWSFHARAQPE